MLDPKIDTFLKVCELRNFTRAAEMLGLTQPAVSRQMKSLEEFYGVSLFCFEGKKLSLTDAGNLLYRRALTAKSDEQRLLQTLRKKPDTVLRLGSTPTPGEFMLPDILAKYFREYPAPHVQITIQNTESLLEQLNHDQIDLAVAEGNIPKKEYACRLFSIQSFVPVCSAGQSIPSGSLESLLPFPLILREPGSGNREILEYSLKRQGLSLSDFKGIVETNDIKVQKALVQRGCGIAFLFEAAVKGDRAFRILSAEGFPLSHEMNLVWRKNSLFGEEYARLAQYFAGFYH